MVFSRSSWSSVDDVSLMLNGVLYISDFSVFTHIHKRSSEPSVIFERVQRVAGTRKFENLWIKACDLDQTKMMATRKTCEKGRESESHHLFFFFCRKNCRDNLMDEDEKDRAKR